MKKMYLFISALLVMLLTSMMLVEENQNQSTDSFTFEDDQPKFHRGMITIKVKEGIRDLGKQRGNISFNVPSLNAKAQKYEVDLLEKRFNYNPMKHKKGMPDLSRIYRIEFPDKYPVTKVAREFSNDPNIEYAEPIPIPYPGVVPNDPMYGDLHYLTQIMADSAWEIHKGEDGPDDIIIAIVDSGTEWDHEDLVDNIWQNMGEDLDGDGHTIEFNGSAWIHDPDDENGVDDDGNGFVDDFIGWNFYYDNNDPNPTPGFYMWTHGTLMGGYASATTNNNVGIASLSWNLDIMVLQAGWDNPSLGAYNAIIYAAENGADVISNSWGHYWFSQAYLEAVEYAQNLGSIILGNAANSNEFRLYYPIAYPGVLGVAATNHQDVKASYSNYGPHIDISAPGGDGSGSTLMLTTTVNNSYEATAGTSCSTPLVASLLALVKSYHPEWTSDQVITQVLGTVDTIDYLNPGFENQLGAGRINALNALVSTTAEFQQEIALDLFSSFFIDSDGNQMAESGDTVTLSLELINYNYGVGSDNAMFTLSSNDPNITLVNDSFICDIPADGFFTLENAFEFIISNEASAHIAEFEVSVNADKEITWGETINLNFLVVPAGILVFQDGSGNGYSGDFLNDYLVDEGFDVLYTSHFPSSLYGFDAVFISLGNCGQSLGEGTNFTHNMLQAIADFLYQGGKLYLEYGSYFTAQYYLGYPSLDEHLELFGVEESHYLSYYNGISDLLGIENSFCHDLEFGASTQNICWFINEMTPNNYGTAALEEDGYGTVAIHSEGEYGQKTFIFSYALGHLMDGPNGTKDELMSRIVEFLDLLDPKADFMADATFIEEGDTIHFTDLSENSPTSWEWEFEGGTPETSNDPNPEVTYYTPGVFDVTLVVTNEYGSDSLTIEDYITVDPATGFITEKINELLIYPNPINSYLIFEFCLENDSPVHISMLDIHGRIVTDIVQEEFARGKKLVTLNTEKLPPAIYFCHLKMGNEIITRKVVKIE